MIGVDFLERSLPQRWWDAVRAGFALAWRRIDRSVVISVVAVVMIAAVESIRLHNGLERAAEVDSAQRAVMLQVAALRQRASVTRGRQAALLHVLELRRSNAVFADQVGRLGNILVPATTVSTIRQGGDVREIEGRVASLDDLRRTLRGLQRVIPARARTRLEIVRDERAREVLTFVLAFGADDVGTLAR